jgi:hypothetical protein
MKRWHVTVTDDRGRTKRFVFDDDVDAAACYASAYRHGFTVTVVQVTSHREGVKAR